MENNLRKQINQLRVVVACLVVLNIGFITITLFRVNNNQNAKFEVIDAQKINIVEKDGTRKLSLFGNDQLEIGSDVRSNMEFAGMLFYNNEGYECGGLTYSGRKIEGGQKANSGLMFDGYRQDQTIALQHNEFKENGRAEYDDGLAIIYQPDRALVEESYKFEKLYSNFKGTETQKDSLLYTYANENKVIARRLFIGNRRGLNESGDFFSETGLFIKNKYRRNAMRIYVDNDGKPHFEVYDTLGKSLIYDFDFKKRSSVD